MLDEKINLAFSISGTPTGVELTGTPGNHTDWNAVSAAVGCGSGRFFLLYNSYSLTFAVAATPQQFTCMQKVPAMTLEQAVISTGATFSLIIDSTSFTS